jgi:uncharacterized integral membrane protein
MKTWVLVALVVLVAVVVVQNAAVVTVRFLFWQVSLSQVVVLLATFAAGVAAGFGAAKLPPRGQGGPVTGPGTPPR